MFDNQIRRNAREGYKIGDKFVFLSLLTGLLFIDHLRRPINGVETYRSNKSLKELEKEVAELQKQLAKPFRFQRSIVIYSILLALAILTPFIGAYLYLQADWWMFFCVLLSGTIELLCIMPLGMLNESISTDWKYDPDSVDKITKQIKSILWTSIIGVGISAIMCGYPFILPYKESTLVIILTALIFFFNLVCLYELICTLKNVEIKIKENIQRFAEEK